MTITINFPALDSLVAYLKGQDQNKINTAAQQIETLIERLNKSAANLSAAASNSEIEVQNQLEQEK